MDTSMKSTTLTHLSITSITMDKLDWSVLHHLFTYSIQSTICSEWKKLKNCCHKSVGSATGAELVCPDDCNFWQFITSIPGGNYSSKNDTQGCGDLVIDVIQYIQNFIE
jgi:hypothetical protein